jgi:murein DD-endopeptidase MepM/ murein hydrolase activator NlpD
MLQKTKTSANVLETVAENVPSPIDTTMLATLPLNTEVSLLINEPILPSIEELLAADNKTHVPPTFYDIVRPYQKMRNDRKGDGHFGASRGRRRHNGLDIEVLPGHAVYCPIEGIMKRVAYPYGRSRRNGKWLGCAIEGTGLYRGYEVKIFYMHPFLLGEDVYPNDIIGKAQAISKRYSRAMTDHLHVEVRYKGQLVDPATLFKLQKQ